MLCFRHEKCEKRHKQSQFTSKFILTSVCKQSNLIDIIIPWVASLTLYKLASQNLHPATTFLQLVAKRHSNERLLILLWAYKFIHYFITKLHRALLPLLIEGRQRAVVSEIQTLDASINLSCQSANNLNREMYSEKESYWVFFPPHSTAHISSRPDFRTLLAQETFATVSSLQNALHSTSLSYHWFKVYDIKAAKFGL